MHKMLLAAGLRPDQSAPQAPSRNKKGREREKRKGRNGRESLIGRKRGEGSSGGASPGRARSNDHGWKIHCPGSALPIALLR